MCKHSIFVGLFLVGMVAGNCSFEAMADTGTVMNIPMTTSSPLAKSHFLKGLHELDLNKPAKALPHFQSASKADPDFALASLGVADASASPDAFLSSSSVRPMPCRSSQPVSEIEPSSWFVSRCCAQCLG